MALTIGQLASSAGYVSEGMRTAEEAQRQARQNQLQIEAQNRANQAAIERQAARAGLQIPNMPQFPGMTGGQQFAQPGAQTQPGQPASSAEAFPVNMNAPQAKPLGLNVPVPAAPAPAMVPTTSTAPPDTSTAYGRYQVSSQFDPSTPLGRAGQQLEESVATRQERDALITRLNYKYGSAAGFGGLFMQQTDKQRQEAKAIMDRLGSLTTEELRNLEQTGQLPPAGIRPELAKAMEQTESGGVTTAVSPKGATGLMQVMIPTAMDPGFGLPTVFEFALQQGVEVKNTTEDEARRLLKDPKIGGPYGLLYANTMSQRYGGDETLMLVAYNWGPGNADKWAASGRNPMDLPRETRDYVIKNLGLAGGDKPIFNENPSKTADNIAASITAPAAAGVMYGPSEVPGGMQNPGIQSAMMLRQTLADDYQIFNNNRMFDQADQALAQVAAIDLGLFKAQGDLGIQELTVSGDASRAMSVLSQFTGTPTQALARGDGTYDLYQNGRVTQTAVPVDKLAELVKTTIDAEYRASKAALAAERSGKVFEKDLELRNKIQEEVVKAQGNIQKAFVEGNIRLLEQQYGVEIKPDSNGGIAYVRRGREIQVLDPNTMTQIRGQSVRTPTTYNIQ